MATSPGQKVLFMGLGASGKSSIRSVVFEGKSAEDVADYRATINYARSTKNLIGSSFQIFDCGGQESFISNFIGGQAEFIFSDVIILIWVVDVSNIDQVSTSKFYFDHAIENLKKYSPGAEAFCLFHKIDLLLPDMKTQLIDTMKQYFAPPVEVELSYHPTSIFDQSIFNTFGIIIQNMLSQTIKTKSVDETIRDFVQSSEELAGITIYTDEGLPIFTGGESDRTVLPANLWLASSTRISDIFKTDNVLKSTVETDDYILVFQRIKEQLLLTGIAKKIAPLNYVLVKMDELAKTVNKLLEERQISAKDVYY